MKLITGKVHSRRELLVQGGASIAGGLLIPGKVWGLNPESVGANEQVRLAIIGCGVRGNQLARNMPPEAHVVAVADADLPKADQLASTFSYRVQPVQDYRRLFDRHDLDAVMVCTVDHHHAHAGILASLAGLDSYIEKPLTAYFAEGRALVQAARHAGRVVQTGTQQRTMEMDRFACKLVRDGGIGEIKVVECVNYGSSMPYPKEGLPEQPVRPGLSWELWQGPAQRHPFNVMLAARWEDQVGGYWSQWSDYSAGMTGGMGAHSFDMVQYALGMDETGPVEFIPLQPDEAGVPKITFRYSNGIEVRLHLPDMRPYRGPRLGAIFTGSKCKIEINRNKFATNPPDFVADPPDPALAAKWEGDGWIARGHVENWLDCIKSRQRPNADVEIGHRTATICHLCNITRWLGRRLRWDPEQEVFPDDPEANQLLNRPRAKGWELPTIG